MLTNSEQPATTAFGHEIDHNYVCEFCDRSLEARFGDIPPAQCDSCRDGFDLLNAAGKIELL